MHTAYIHSWMMDPPSVLRRVAASSVNSYLECINFSHDMMPSIAWKLGSLLTVTVSKYCQQSSGDIKEQPGSKSVN